MRAGAFLAKALCSLPVPADLRSMPQSESWGILCLLGNRHTKEALSKLEVCETGPDRESSGMILYKIMV